MASTDKPDVENVAAPAPEKGAAAPEVPPRSSLTVVEVVLRVLLFVTTLTAVVVMVTSKQTEWVPVPVPPFRRLNSARWTDSPALVYFVAALSVAGLYSIISTLFSISALSKPGNWKFLVSHFVLLDVLLLGIIASAAGAAGAVAYVGLKGNSHSGWVKICTIYDTYCAHVASSVGVAMVAAFVLVLLILLSVFALIKKSLK
ncbi:hypothetical protein DCAR_0102545 [Daucus carota subsp. sativus]|uniref:CASP-like protein n=1 Tax=Daucus carota subsp. sativus TaxID=79200 RepID=A0A169WQL7_DAUCS|nr:PREDICTED: CASP-like protein 1 [Daucus carota subsp. sativus]WOG83370.1 hypothetical protein DCAR_0102545 [Daucus carota subsp. sativus]